MVTFTRGTNVYQFRNPELGNVDELAFQRINRRTRGGDLIIYRDNDWPKTEVQNLTFNLLSEADGRRMLQMVKECLGIEIQYTDHEAVTWVGVIQNPEAALIQTGRTSYAITIRFEGDIA